jgi:hypothetical protein
VEVQGVMLNTTAEDQTAISMVAVGLCVGISALLWDSQESTDKSV